MLTSCATPSSSRKRRGPEPPVQRRSRDGGRAWRVRHGTATRAASGDTEETLLGYIKSALALKGREDGEECHETGQEMGRWRGPRPRRGIGPPAAWRPGWAQASTAAAALYEGGRQPPPLSTRRAPCAASRRRSPRDAAARCTRRALRARARFRLAAGGASPPPNRRASRGSHSLSGDQTAAPLRGGRGWGGVRGSRCLGGAAPRQRGKRMAAAEARELVLGEGKQKEE